MTEGEYVVLVIGPRKRYERFLRSLQSDLRERGRRRVRARHFLRMLRDKPVVHVTEPSQLEGFSLDPRCGEDVLVDVTDGEPEYRDLLSLAYALCPARGIVLDSHC
jgi:hypothetical protein